MLELTQYLKIINPYFCSYQDITYLVVCNPLDRTKCIFIKVLPNMSIYTNIDYVVSWINGVMTFEFDGLIDDPLFLETFSDVLLLSESLAVNLGIDTIVNDSSDIEELITMPDYFLRKDGYYSINSEFGEPAGYKDLNNLEYFGNKNKIQELTFSESDLKNPLQTFTSLWLSFANPINKNKVSNSIYEATLNFFANGGQDEATNLMGLILGTSTTSEEDCNCTKLKYLTGNTSSCGCGTNSDSSGTSDCTTQYAEAMKNNLPKMLGDIEFLCDWLLMEQDDDVQFNEVLYDILINFLENLIEYINLNGTINNTQTHQMCRCSDLSDDSTETFLNAINNYIKVLGWAKEDKMMVNKNKIYLYGKEFANQLL